MNKYRQTIMRIMLIPLIMVQTSCDDAVETPNLGVSTNDNAIAFAPIIANETGDGEPQTRVSTDAAFNSAWENGDAVGIFAVSHANGANAALASSFNYIDNAAVTYNAGAWKMSPAPLYNYPANGNRLDFYAYYPRQAGINDARAMTFTVQTDQSTAANFKKSELLLAKLTNVASPTNPVPLTFRHAMAMIQVEIPGKNDITGVILQGVKTGASISWTAANPTVAVINTLPKTDIKMFRVSGTNLFRALLPPQTLTGGWFSTGGVLIEQNGKRTASSSISATLTQGGVTKFVILPPSSVQIPAGTNSAISGFSTPGFLMDKFEVTKEQFCEFLNAANVGADRIGNVDGTAQELFSEQTDGKTPRWDGSKWFTEGTPNTPMVYVNWFGATAYAAWAGGRLPTMQEWQYACRAGTTAMYFFGDASQLTNYAWYFSNSQGGTHPVGTKLPNPWGLYDIYGNVWEWTSDINGNDSRIRGGAWNSVGATSLYENSIPSGDFRDTVGFRIIYNQQ